MTPASTPREKRLAFFAWLAVCVIWGTTYLGIRVTLETMPPALMSAARWLVAGGLLIVYVLSRREPLPPRSSWPGIVLVGFLLLVIGNGGVAFAEQWVPSGLAAVLVATSPFWMAGVEACLPNGERLTSRAFAGLLVGFAGIVVLVWPELTLGGAASRQFLLGVVLLQVAAFGWSLGSAYTRRHGQDHLLGATALQMLAGGVMLLVVGLARGEWSQFGFSPRSSVALAYLATVGAVGGFVAYTYALRHLAVSFVSLYAYINPVIAVVLGVLLLSEPFNLRIAAAAALVLVGVAIVRSKGRERGPGSGVRDHSGTQTGKTRDPGSRAPDRDAVDGQPAGTSVREPSANVIVPSTTTVPPTRAMPRS
jgi:drug/metabolite transporter (DMT)-like permease